MKQYRGYYIDHVIFNSKQEIDEFIKEQAIEHHKNLSEMFAKKPSIELAAWISDSEKRLHDVFGLEYDEIEQIEIEAIKTA